jgi:hypothetical protein
MLPILAGCATFGVAPLDTAPSVRLLLGESEAALRALVTDLQAPTAPVEWRAAGTTVDSARVAVAARALVSNPAQADAPGLIAAGVTLRLCQDGLDRLETRAAADRAAAARLARGEFTLTCLVPLAALSVR